MSSFCCFLNDFGWISTNFEDDGFDERKLGYSNLPKIALYFISIEFHDDHCTGIGNGIGSKNVSRSLDFLGILSIRHEIIACPNLFIHRIYTERT
jgi:hypothetical protein